MNKALIFMCIVVQGVLSRPITLRLPCDNRDLIDINITTTGQILNWEASQVYEATEGNLIEKVKYFNNTLYMPDGVDNAINRRVYVEVTRDDTLMSIESIFPQGIDMRYYKLDGHEAVKISFFQFLGMLNRARR